MYRQLVRLDKITLDVQRFEAIVIYPVGGYVPLLWFWAAQFENTLLMLFPRLFPVILTVLEISHQHDSALGPRTYQVCFR